MNKREQLRVTDKLNELEIDVTKLRTILTEKKNVFAVKRFMAFILVIVLLLVDFVFNVSLVTRVGSTVILGTLAYSLISREMSVRFQLFKLDWLFKKI